MKLTILGNEGPFPSEDGATSGYLFKTNALAVCLDMGSGVFAALKKKMDPSKVDAILLSHLHHDHISDLGVYNYYLESLTKKGAYSGKMPCYLPSVTKEEVDSMTARYPYFDFIPVQEGETLLKKGATFRFYKMKHPVTTYGVTVEEEGKVFAYTGDTNVCPSFYEMASACTLLLADGCFTQADHNENLPHLSAALVAEVAKKYDCRAIVTHLSPYFTEEDYRKEIYGDVTLARRFDEYEL